MSSSSEEEEEDDTEDEEYSTDDEEGDSMSRRRRKGAAQRLKQKKTARMKSPDDICVMPPKRPPKQVKLSDAEALGIENAAWAAMKQATRQDDACVIWQMAAYGSKDPWIAQCLPFHMISALLGVDPYDLILGSAAAWNTYTMASLAMGNTSPWSIPRIPPMASNIVIQCKAAYKMLSDRWDETKRHIQTQDYCFNGVR